MKKILPLLFFLLAFTTYGQDKNNYVGFNKITDLQGTDYVIVSVNTYSKLYMEGRYLLFINTRTGESREAGFPEDAHLGAIEQLKLDSLQINKIIVSGRTKDVDGKKGIDWNDPQQLIIMSTDGKEKTQITDDSFFISTWELNKQTGVIVITGHYDSNKNEKYDKTDKHEIQLYDLKTMKMQSRL
ncbi:MAG: hypothetical protein HOP10_16580 [Chitinophagaceae bacterium]|nr:hypothetical protein [Chitinophagaceae bacterium]